METAATPASDGAAVPRWTEVSPANHDLKRYLQIRGQTLDLCEGLSAEDCQAQSMPEASPTKWHLAHTTWFFETFLLQAQPGYRPVCLEYAYLFNSYYHSLGATLPRDNRGQLTRPTLTEVLDYRRRVDEAMQRLLEDGVLDDGARAVLELGLQHEQQHQELILTDLKHLFAHNPLQPAYRILPVPPAGRSAGACSWIRFEEGFFELGHGGSGFAFDNEQPQHRVWLRPYALASRCVTNAEYREFIRAGGYRIPTLWLDDGWTAVQQGRWDRPLYWSEDCEQHFTLAGLRSLDPHAPVCHLSYYEADAFARWAGARLPREEEWERAAASEPVRGNFAESGFLQPRAAVQPEWFGNVWQWTQSPYAAYPGYRPYAGAAGEYNAKFTCNQFVLRGGSCVSRAGHLRASYRNFFYPQARWQFSGLRLAKDLP